MAMSVVQGKPQRQAPGGMGGEGVKKRDENVTGNWGRLGVEVRGTRSGHGPGDHPNRSTRGSRSVAGASVRSSCPCFSDTRTSVLSALPWLRSPAGSLLEDKRGRQGQVVRVEECTGISF